MRDEIEIEIFLRTPHISDLHETITSIIGQLGLSGLKIFLTIKNPFNLPIEAELNRLKKNNIDYGKAKTRFYLSLDSGDVLSRSFLYKATKYLNLNSAGFVCPEYTIKRVSFRPIIIGSNNAKLPLSATKAALIDRSKTTASPFSEIIKDTCIATSNIDTSIHQYIKSLPNDIALTGPFLFPKNLANTIVKPANLPRQNKLYHLKSKAKNLAISFSGRSKILNNLLFKHTKKCDRHHLPNSYYIKQAIFINDQMRNELNFVANCKYAIKGFDAMTFANLTSHITNSQSSLLETYLSITSHLHYDNYDYICILPWLISGGIDLFSINYLRTIPKIYPDYHILVILTNDFHKSFTKEELNLPDNIDFLNLPEIINTKKEEKEETMEKLIHSIINIFDPKYLHIIASKIGYNVVIKSGDDFRKHGTNLIFSSYNYLVGPHNEYMGYTVEELPRAYRPGDTITTDNANSKTIWINQYGFRAEDILVHSQLFKNVKSITTSSKNGVKILWAAHVRPEKNPEIVPAIAKALIKEHIEIDCYGLFMKDNWKTGENPLDTNIQNLHYKGPYSNFFTDINLPEYDLFLYTSHSDGTPNVILEAALAGLPIVSSDIGGIAEATLGKIALVENSYSVEEFLSAIRYVLSHHEESTKKAAALRNKLLLIHSENNFIEQTKSMLNRNKNV